MNRFTSAIRKSVDDKNWFSALFIALAMPDICGSIETPKEKNGARYRRWFNENLEQHYIFKTAYDTTKLLRPQEIERLELTAEHNAESAKILDKLKNHIIPEQILLTAEKCYALRNSCLHSGMSKDERRKFAFIPPLDGGGGSHLNFINDTLVIRIDKFCEDVCLAVDNWFESKKGDSEIQNRISELLEVSHNPFPRVYFNK
ncbi:hypothetical protein DZA65_02079 [Dickeya dianthicola]|uniref:Uncharacterized protein n=1 Tax=Dickeya dianthicola TaxID=204039 RepID=A0AAP6RYR4_9GAMM|nr:hypothetical protein [Dickeya dianthicola]AYC18968.1 hypothetical protein DZA65_02079 [Dickeya dianthicola]MBI0439569.1 hypothetical protein [Dickeya dianthicola]MBI0449967.1 hypothetical protein [Dickeya dianthicola]MBI0454579.1 hypothetical protein [Dickeya dianthicola]MBI0458708.1 hypothetical protein [Dickeya dianthicola]